MLRLDLIGNLGHDPDAKYTPQGKMVVNASVGVTVGWGDNKRTEWVKLVLWEKSAESFNQIAQKGTTVWVSGTPKLSTWLSKKNEAQGQMELTVREFKILKGGRPKDGSEPDEDEPGFLRD
jgi:single-strand DNA-binding protein